MPITIIDKLKQPNNLTFKIIDSIDVEHTYIDDANVEQSIGLKDYLDDLSEKIESKEIVVDVTLTQEGVAADAKAVGGAIEKIQTQIGEDSVSEQISSAIESIEHPVDSVNGKTGVVELTAADVGALPSNTEIPSIEGLATEKYVDNAVSTKVDKVEGKGLSTNDYTTAEKEKLAGIEVGANKTIVDESLTQDGTNPVQGKAIFDKIAKLVGDTSVSDQIDAAIDDIAFPVTSVNSKTGAVTLTAADVGALPADTSIPSIEGLATEQYVNDAVKNKVDAVDGKGLSSNDYTDEEKTKLSGIEAGANKTIVDTELSVDSTNPVQNKVIANKIHELVGDTTVSDQISEAIADKADTNHNHDSAYDAKGSADTALSSAKKYTDENKTLVQIITLEADD